jgi:hypothetical protein
MTCGFGSFHSRLISQIAAHAYTITHHERRSICNGPFPSRFELSGSTLSVSSLSAVWSFPRSVGHSQTAKELGRCDGKQHHQEERRSSIILFCSYYGMASDLEARMMEEEEAKNPCGVPECLVDMNKRIINNGGGFVDNVKAISTNLTREVTLKAFRLLVDFKEPGLSTERPGHGQAGLIRQDMINTSLGGSDEYAVVPVTAKHNLHKWGKYEARNPKMFLKANESIKIDTPFPDTNWTMAPADRVSLRTENKESRPGFWKYGVDVSASEKIGCVGEWFTNKNRSFGAVRHGFIPLEGVQVGIAVLFTSDSKPTNKTIAGVGQEEVAMEPEDIENVFGKPGVVNIYTGKIQFVGTNHIEYDINSFTGCSGAVVFLLDGEDQHNSVQKCDHGKAIAIHGGAHPTLTDRNLGFLLSNVLP